VALDAHGKIAWGRSDIGGDPIVVVLTEMVADAHLAGLRGEGVSCFFAGKSELDLALVLDILNSELGVKRLLLEGGGGETDQCAPVTAMALESNRVLEGGAMLLRYRIQNADAAAAAGR
jgi:hypothetical protein